MQLSGVPVKLFLSSTLKRILKCAFQMAYTSATTARSRNTYVTHTQIKQKQ
jgi:hypothetical protein